MQVTETSAEGLKRSYKVVIPAAVLEQRVTQKLEEIRGQVKINGFRPGKVPLSHLKKMYGRSVFGEAVEAALGEANRKIIDEHKVRFAMQPEIKLPESEEEIEKLFTGSSDLTYDVNVEILPTIEVGDLKSIKVERLAADVEDKSIDEALERIAKQSRSYAEKKEKAKAAQEDRVTLNYDGTIDGQPFDGGKGENIIVDIGSNTFIPGFEEQLVGAKVGEERTVTATFPANYMRQDLAGKTGEFKVKVTKLEEPEASKIDDEFAKGVGFEGLEDLRKAVSEQIEKEQKNISRTVMKRKLLDELDKMHQFDLPSTLVDQEFNAIWGQIEREREQGELSAEDAGKSEDDLKAEYRGIAGRRVRLGLLLAEIGERAKVVISDDEVGRALMDRARQFPGREKQVWDYYRKSPEAMAEIRAPLFEEKVVDYVVELASVTEKKVSRDDLVAQVDEEPSR
jgi:trigger factor